MARYRILIKESVTKDLRDLPSKDVRLILTRIQSLAENPRPPGAQKLAGNDKYRVRQGQYRILYTIDDQEIVVIVVKVGHRREVYR